MTEAPANYKEVSMDKDGKLVFSEVKGKKAEALTGVTAELLTQSSYGDYQLNLDGLPEDKITSSNVNAVVVKTTDGTAYGMRHLENIWRGNELAWSTVTSTGYTTPLTFTYKVPGETPAPSEVDITKLAAAIEKAEGLNESDYTADSWKALQSALAEADTALKEKKDQDTVDKATEKLNKAISALVKKDAGQKVNGTNGTTGTSGKSGKTGSTSNTKSGKAAKTGDPSSMFAWLGLAVTSLGAGIGGFSLKRKKREDEE